MLNHYIQFHANATIDLVIKFLISVLLLCFLGPIVIEMKGEMPVTLQSLVILFVAIAFGWRVGVSAVLVYIIIGVAGAPVFAAYKSGANALYGTYAGFFFGFVASAAICGYLTELEAFRKTLPAILNWFFGHAIIILLGSLWMYQLRVDGWQEKISAVLTGAIVKSLIGAVIIQLIIRFMSGKRKKAFVE